MGSGWGAPVPAGRGSPGSPRCGSRRTPLSASRGGASPGETALPERLRCAPLSPGPQPEKLRGDPSRASAWEGGGGRAQWPPHPAPRLARGRAAPGGSATGGEKKIPTGSRVYKKQPTKRRFWQISISLLFPAPAPMPPSRLPSLRSGIAAWCPPPPALPLPGSGEAGRSPSFPGGTGPSLPLTFPCPFYRVREGASSLAHPPGSGQGSALQGGRRRARRQGDPPHTSEKRGGTGAYRSRPASPSGTLPGGGDGGEGVPAPPGRRPRPVPRGAHHMRAWEPESAAPPPPGLQLPAARGAPRWPPANQRDAESGARFEWGRARGGAGEPPAGRRRGLRRCLSLPRVLMSPASLRDPAEGRTGDKVELSGPVVCGSTPLLFIP